MLFRKFVLWLFAGVICFGTFVLKIPRIAIVYVVVEICRYAVQILNQTPREAYYKKKKRSFPVTHNVELKRIYDLNCVPRSK